MHNKSFVYLFLILLFSSCEEDSNLPEVGAGSFVDSSGSCSEMSIAGDYVSGTTLNESNSVNIKINVTVIGKYSISTEDINGYSFSRVGEFTDTGIQDVALKGVGTPLEAQTDIFHIKFGNSSCSFEIKSVSEPSEMDLSNRIILTSGEHHMSDYIYTYAFDGHGNKLWSRPTGWTFASIVDDIAYLANGTALRAVDVLTGEDIWVIESTEDVRFSSEAVLLSENVIYASGSRGNLYAIDAVNGSILWVYNTGSYGDISSSPTIGNNTIYFGGMGIYAINKDGSLKWKYITEDLVRSSPAVAENKVFINANKGNLHALDAETGMLLWEYPVDAAMDESPTVSNGKVYTQGKHKVFCLDAENGELIWEYQFSREAHWASPIENNGVLYVGATPEGVKAFNAADGTFLWNNSILGYERTNSPTVFDNVIYITGHAGISAVDAATGQKIWNYGKPDAWSPGTSLTLYTPAVVYDLETNRTEYPSSSGHRQ